MEQDTSTKNQHPRGRLYRGRPSLFRLGRIVATPAALQLLQDEQRQPGEFLAKHRTGDWGVLDPEDERANAEALDQGYRLLSSYPLRTGTLWIITEADRCTTTLLIPEDY